MIPLVDQYGVPIQIDQDVPLNSNWYTWAENWVGAIYNPDSIPASEYDRIYQQDETVFSGVQILVHSILSRLGDYTHQDPDKELFVRTQFEQMHGSIRKVMAEKLVSAIVFGFSLAENVYKQIPGGIGLASIQVLHPKDVSLELHREGPEKNRVARFFQYKDGLAHAELPPAKCIHMVHEGFAGNPFGVSRLKRAWKSMFIKDVLLRAYGTCLERYGTPITTAEATNLSGQVNYAGQIYSGADFVGRQLDSLGRKGVLVLPNGTSVKIHYAPAGLGADFLAAIQYCNRSIHQAIGLPSLVADSGSVGSYSLGQEHSATFQLIVTSILEDLIDILLDQLVRPLLEYNFGPQEDLGDFSVDVFDPVLAKATAEASAVLLNSGVADASRLADLNLLRERNDLPPLTEEDLSTQYPSMSPSRIAGVEEDQAPTSSLMGRRRRRVRTEFAHAESRRAKRMERFTLSLPNEMISELLPTG